MQEKTPKSWAGETNINKLVFLAIIIALFYFLVGNDETKNASGVKVPFPQVNSVANNKSFACESLVSADIIGSPKEYLTNGVEGSVQKGTDTVAMNIKNAEVLSFLSGASIKIGVSEGDNFAIIHNDKEKLLAVWFNENAISSIVLNKTNGLAVWLKGNPSFLGYETPFGSIVYLVCR